MKARIFSITTLFLVMCLKSGFAQTPEDFNKRMMDIVNNVAGSQSEWTTKMLQLSLKPGNFADLKPLRIATENTLARNLQELQKMKDVKGSGELRKAVMDLLKYQEQVVAQGYVPFEKFDKNTGEKTINNAIHHIDELEKKEKVLAGKMNKAQNGYAKKNNFTFKWP